MRSSGRISVRQPERHSFLLLKDLGLGAEALSAQRAGTGQALLSFPFRSS